MAWHTLSLQNMFWFIFFSCNWHSPALYFSRCGGGFHHPGAISLYGCAPSQLPGRLLKNGPVCGQAHKGLSGPPFLFGACAAVCETRPGPRWALSTCNEQLWVLTQQAWPCRGSTTALRRDPRLWVTRFLFSLASAVHISSSFQGESITEGAHKLFNMN